MMQWIARLLGSGTLDADSPLVRFEFAHPLALWQWLAVAAGAATLGWWAYTRIEGRAWVRAALGAARVALLALLCFLLAGPRLVETTETVDRDWVLALVDRSASMNVADAPPGPGGAPASRQQQLADMIQANRQPLIDLATQRTVKWLGFDSGLFELPLDSALPILDAPIGRRTDLAGAIEQALVRGAARPIAGLVVFSDGRSQQSVPRALLRRLTAERIPVVVVPLGSGRGLLDLSIAAVEAPAAAFVNDPIPLRIRVARAGAASAGPGRIELVDTQSGQVLDSQPITWDTPAPGATQAESQSVTLTGQQAQGDRTAWQVRLVPDDGKPDLVPANDKAQVAFSLVDRPLRLLYIDGYPRWEYRFLKNIFSRDPSITFSSMLLSPGRRYLGEGADDLAALPDSPAGWDAFDVIMIGDVQPGVLNQSQLEQVRNRVAVGGAGLLWIAGQGAVPQAYRATPLADLLPITGGAAGDRPPAWDRDVVLKPTPLAEQLGVLRLADRQPDGSFWPAQASDPAAGWSRFRWLQRLDPGTIKPAAEPLANASPVDDGTDPTPAVLTMRFGAGRTVYVATDELWRFRYGKGEELPERFYMQLIRLLGRESVARAGKPAALTLTPSQAEVGSTVRIAVELIDQALIDARPGSITVRINPPAAPSAGPALLAAEITLRPSGDGRSFVGAWVPPASGTWTGVVTDALLEAKGVSGIVEVFQRDDELRFPEADHTTLTQLAQETGGAVLDAQSLSRLGQLLPRREVRTISIARQETLWDRPMVLAALLGLLAVEWVGRRLIRLI